MRVWIDPAAPPLNLTAGEIVAALRAQNVQVSSGALGQPPYAKGEAFQLGVETQGRLTEPQQFADIVIRTDAAGHQVRVRDVARVELGAQDYGINTYLSNKPTVVIAVMQRPAPTLWPPPGGQGRDGHHRQGFPKGMEYSTIYNPTEFISQSIDAVYHTLFEAVVLVVLVILSSCKAGARRSFRCWPSRSRWWARRHAAAVGYSLNNLSLFGLVLAIGIVVDDAIVVVENVGMALGMPRWKPRAPRWTRWHRAGGHRAGACAVFVPTLFITGLSGQFYKQFAVTISPRR
jgi:multidrug efflux pump subunit AcrB